MNERQAGTNPRALQVQSLCCTLQGSNVLNRISFSVSFGEFVSILGPNGAGKTTLLRCLINLLPSTGSILIDGLELREQKPGKLATIVSYVPQQTSAPEGFTVRDFVLMARYPHSKRVFKYSERDQAVTDQALESVGISQLSSRLLSSLSGGEQRRVFLSAALAQECKIILLDEPAAFLDPCSESDVYQLLRDIQLKQKLTVLAVSHNVNRAALVSDRVLGIKSGSIAFDGSARELMEERSLKQIYANDFLFVDHPELGIPMILPRGAK